MDKAELIKEKVEILNRAAKAYYVDGQEIMSNFEYDKLYDELVALEEETGIILASSPTQNVGYEVLSSLPKENHPSPMLSLDKTKSVEDLTAFVGDNDTLISWKLDGLTVVLTYEEGKLFKAVTRGNGTVGEVITNNAKVFANVPLTIPCKESLVIRGEAIITYSEFERINQEIPEAEAKYKNPRNLCSGSVRQLNNQITAERNVRFIAFNLVSGIGETRSEQFQFLEQQGFEVVDYKRINGQDSLLDPKHMDTVADAVYWFSKEIETNDYPSDGLVITYNDIAYGKSLGTTAKFPRDSIAFKWADEVAETTLREIEWSASRTGLINPVAIFDPVELEGTTVKRASVHNVSIMRELKLGIGDRIKVYKANMIIPQISENLTGSCNVEIPKTCPVCGGETKIKDENGVQTLFCVSDNCPAKEIFSFEHFASRNALNIEGLSEATIERLVDIGAIKTFVDFFRLDRFKDKIVEIEGLGEKSFDNLMASVKAARTTTAARLIYALGIAGIGTANAKLIAAKGMGDMSVIMNMDMDTLLEIDGVGEVMAGAFRAFFDDEEKRALVDELLTELEIEAQAMAEVQNLAGMTVVITGSLNHFENRDALKAEVEKRGGKVAGSVSAKTAYLVNNDVNSTSSKNKKAKDVGVPIVSEEEFMNMFEIEGTK